MRKFHYINDDVEIDFPLGPFIKEIVDLCEKYDREDNIGAYMNYADFLTEVLCKELVVTGKMTPSQWELMERRYGDYG